MIFNPNASGIFYCRDCREDVRIIPSGDEPSVSCMRCGGVNWIALSPEERERMFEDTSKLETARVFFCMSTGCHKPVVLWGEAAEVDPCDCGSRMFEELIGPARMEWLRANPQTGAKQ